jgi:hypothetical protein
MPEGHALLPSAALQAFPPCGNSGSWCGSGSFSLCLLKPVPRSHREPQTLWVPAPADLCRLLLTPGYCCWLGIPQVADGLTRGAVLGSWSVRPHLHSRCVLAASSALSRPDCLGNRGVGAIPGAVPTPTPPGELVRCVIEGVVDLRLQVCTRPTTG